MPIKEELVADPPASRTFPFGSRMAAACQRRSCIEPVNVHLPVAGSNNSALERKVLPAPPAARTFPLDKSVPISLWHGRLRPPVSSQFPPTGSYSSKLMQKSIAPLNCPANSTVQM